MRKLLKHPILIIAASCIITAVLAVPLRTIQIESSIRQFFPTKHEAYMRLNETEEQFGSMISIGISLETPADTILTSEYISAIRTLTQHLENIEYTDNVTSITNIDYIEGIDGAINVAPLLENNDDGAITDTDVVNITERLANWEDMYNLVVISNDGKATQVSLTVDPSISPNEQQEVLDKVRGVVIEDLKETDLIYKLYGDPVTSENSKAYLLTDLISLIPLVVLVVLISLYFSFHTLDGTILPLITVLMSTVWSVGIMALTGISFSLVSSVIPVALIGCGSAYGIHVLTHYYIAVDKKRKELDSQGQKFSKEIHLDCICEGLTNVSEAVVLSAITTIVGFISLVTSPIKPLFSFAIFTAIGIGFSLILSVTVIPSFLTLKRVEKIGMRSRRMEKITQRVRRRLEKVEFSKFHKGDSNPEQAGLANSLYNVYHFLCGTKPRMIVFSIIVIALSAFGLSKLVIDTSMINYFPSKAPIRQDVNYVNDNFAGTNSVYLLINSPAAKPKAEAKKLFDQAQAIIDNAEASGRELTSDEKSKYDQLVAQANDKIAESRSMPDMTNVEALRAVDLMESWILSKYDVIGKAVSYTDSIKRINQTWNAPGANASQSTYYNDYSDGSLDDDFGMSDFGMDAFGDDAFGDDFSMDAFGADAFGDEALSDSTTGDSSFVDPNIAYEQMLNQTVTAKDVQELIGHAYAKAGGRRASVEDFVKTLQKEMNFNGAAFYEIPYDPAKYMKSARGELAGIVSNYTQMLGDSMERFTDDQTNFTPTVIRMQVQIRTNSTQVVGKMIKDFEKYCDTHLPEGYYMEATGSGEMEYVMTNLVVKSQMTSLILSIILVFVVLTLSFKSPVAGCIGAIPLAFTIILNYMVMGIAGIKLDLITSIIASVAIGVGIDYTIHFMTEYRTLREQSDNLEEVTRETFKSSGSGIITNAIAVGLGFLVLCFSRFVVLRYIGILIAIVMLTSSTLAMTVLPGIFNIFDPKFLHKGQPKAWETEEDNK